MSLAIPKEVRVDLWPILDDAILDSRSEITLEVDPDLAAHIARERLFAGAQIRVALVGEHQSVALDILDLALPHFLFYQACHRIEAMKLDLNKPMANNIVSLSELQEECYAALLSYKIEGRKSAVIKFVGDMTLGELFVVGKQYSQKRAAASKRESYIDAMCGAMVRAGAADETLVSQVVNSTPVTV